MYNIKKETLNRVIAVIAILAVLMIAVPNRVYAASTTNWGNSNKTHVGTMNVYNNNTTPVKNITKSGTLNLWFKYTKADSYSGNVMLKIIVYVNGTQKIYYEHYHTGTEELIPTCYVNSGDKVQIFTDVCTSGGQSSHYRSATISYSYAIK